MKDTRKNIRINNITQLLLGIVIIILLNVISSQLFTRFDLTSEKRYTLSDATIKMLRDIDDLVYFKVYLEGEFPAGFKRLARETKEMLDEFRAYNKNIQYEFINPSASSSREEREKIYAQLISKGLEPTDLQVKTKEGMSQKIIFFFFLTKKSDLKIPIWLLWLKRSVSPEEIV